MHGQHKHSKEWEAYQEHLKEQKEKAAETRQEQQLEATLALAGKREAPAPVLRGVCDECGKSGLKNVASHKRWAHKE